MISQTDATTLSPATTTSIPSSKSPVANGQANDDNDNSASIHNSSNGTKCSKGNSVKKRKRFDETIIDGFAILAFKTWEDLQEELNERIDDGATRTVAHNDNDAGDVGASAKNNNNNNNNNNGLSAADSNKKARKKSSSKVLTDQCKDSGDMASTTATSTNTNLAIKNKKDKSSKKKELAANDNELDRHHHHHNHNHHQSSKDKRNKTSSSEKKSTSLKKALEAKELAEKRLSILQEKFKQEQSKNTSNSGDNNDHQLIKTTSTDQYATNSPSQHHITTNTTNHHQNKEHNSSSRNVDQNSFDSNRLDSSRTSPRHNHHQHHHINQQQQTPKPMPYSPFHINSQLNSSTNPPGFHLHNNSNNNSNNSPTPPRHQQQNNTSNLNNHHQMHTQHSEHHSFSIPHPHFPHAQLHLQQHLHQQQQSTPPPATSFHHPRQTPPISSQPQHHPPTSAANNTQSTAYSNQSQQRQSQQQQPLPPLNPHHPLFPNPPSHLHPHHLPHHQLGPTMNPYTHHQQSSSIISPMSLNSLPSPYGCPPSIYITDTIHRQTSIIPPTPLGIGAVGAAATTLEQTAASSAVVPSSRFGHASSTSSVLQSITPYAVPPVTPHHPMYYPTLPTERSFMEFARTFTGPGHLGYPNLMSPAFPSPVTPTIPSTLTANPYSSSSSRSSSYDLAARAAFDHHQRAAAASRFNSLYQTVPLDRAFPGYTSARPPSFPAGLFPPPF